MDTYKKIQTLMVDNNKQEYLPTFAHQISFWGSVCTKGSHSLNRAEVNHTPGSYVYTMGFVLANYKMANSTASQLEFVLGSQQEGF